MTLGTSWSLPLLPIAVNNYILLVCASVTIAMILLWNLYSPILPSLWALEQNMPHTP